jgi:hypothetical protein
VVNRGDLAWWWLLLTLWVLALFAVGVVAGVLTRPLPGVPVPVVPVVVPHGWGP